MILNRDQEVEGRRVYRLAVRAGRLIPEPCRICGDPSVDGHHEDYGKPLEVVWLCRMHHRWRHCYGRTIDEMIEVWGRSAEIRAAFEKERAA